MKITNELRQKLLAAKSEKEVDELLKEVGVDGLSAEQVWAELTKKRQAEGIAAAAGAPAAESREPRLCSKGSADGVSASGAAVSASGVFGCSEVPVCPASFFSSLIRVVSLLHTFFSSRAGPLPVRAQEPSGPLISLLCMPSGGDSPLPRRRESAAARKLSLAATAE